MARIGNNAWLAAAAFALVMLIVYVVPRALSMLVPSDVLYLPVLVFFSFCRMLAAFALSVVFSLVYGYYAATNERLAKILLPLLDILQSVPILGFFPAAVFVLINTFHGSVIGIELAAIFLIFTSMAWNMTFGVYESIKSVPEELEQAVSSLGNKRFRYFKVLLLPACMPKLIYNSTVSWAVGWFFLVASEIISLGSSKNSLPGIGSYLVETIARGDIAHALAGFAMLATLIIAMEFFLWRPLVIWAEKFKYDSVLASRQKSRIYRYVKYSPFFINVRLWISAGFDAMTEFLEGSYEWIMEKRAAGTGKIIYNSVKWGAVAIAAYIAFGIATDVAKLAFSIITEPLPQKAFLIPAALAASFAKLMLAYVISLAWTLPMAIVLARREGLESKLLPALEVFASLPATALFPFFILASLALTGDILLATIALILAGMQWYLLFNAIAGAKNLPNDFNEVSRVFHIKGWLYYRKVLLPAMFPSLITGSITAIGGGWNALVVAEYLEYGGKTYSSFGIGSLLSEATYKLADLKLIALTLVAMTLVIVLLNRLVWRPLYDYSARRYRLDATK